MTRSNDSVNNENTKKRDVNDKPLETATPNKSTEETIKTEVVSNDSGDKNSVKHAKQENMKKREENDKPLETATPKKSTKETIVCSENTAPLIQTEQPPLLEVSNDSGIGTESSPENKVVDKENFKKECQEKFDSLFDCLDKNPETWPDISETLVSYFSEQLDRKHKNYDVIRYFTRKIWKRMLKSQHLAVYCEIFEHVQHFKSKHDSILSNFQETYDKYTFRMEDISELETMKSYYKVFIELYKRKFVADLPFKRDMENALQCTESNEKVKMVFACEILRMVDVLIGEKVWKISKDKSEQKFWQKAQKKLFSLPRKYFKKFPDSFEFLVLLSKDGGIFRKRSKRSKSMDNNEETEATERKRPKLLLQHSDICTFLNQDFLRKEVLNEATNYFTSIFEDTSSTMVFENTVESMCQRIFELAGDRSKSKLAIELCAKLFPQTTKSNKKFGSLLQETCVKVFSHTYRLSCEQSLQNIQTEYSSPNAEQTVVLQKYCASENSIRNKFIGCGRVVAGLFLDGHLPFNFFLSLVDCLLSFRSDDMLELLLETLTIAGKHFEQQVHDNSMNMWWNNFFNGLSQLELQYDASPKRKAIIAEIHKMKEVISLSLI